MASESAGVGEGRSGSIGAEGGMPEASVDAVRAEVCPACQSPLPPPRVQTLQQMGRAPIERLRFECGACGHGFSSTAP